MKLRILCLDDYPQTVGSDPLDKVFCPLLTSGAIPTLEGGAASPFLIKGFGEDSIEIELFSNQGTKPEDVVKEIEKKYKRENIDLVLLDDNWGAGDSFAGQEILLEPVLKHIKGISEDFPLVAIFTEHWTDEDRIGKIEKLFRTYGLNRRRITGLSKTDTGSLRLLFQRIISEKAHHAKIIEIQKQLESEKEIAHSHLGLLEHVRQFVGMNDVLLSLGFATEPFFQWARGEYESLPVQLRREFVTGVMIEGEPGTGKTSLCEAVASAFRSEAVLPKTLGPMENPQKWQKPLEEMIKEFYGRALKESVTVIIADDLVWPTIKGMEGGLAADWMSYMNTLRGCIDDAYLINHKKNPTGSIVKKIKGQFKGKILWLFARNADEDVGEMFSPLRDKLMVFNLRFPKSPEDRSAILLNYAKRKSCSIGPEALAMAVRETMGYNGRDLIGDEMASRGFLRFAVRRVQEREEERYRKGKKELDMTITEDIVRDWLRSSEHKQIISESKKDRATFGNAGNEVPERDKDDQGDIDDVQFVIPTGADQSSADFRTVMSYIKLCLKMTRESAGKKRLTLKMIDEHFPKKGRFKAYINANPEIFVMWVECNRGKLVGIIPLLSQNRKVERLLREKNLL